MTHTLQVLHSLQWHQPSKDERALRPKPSLWLATPTPTRYLVLMMNAVRMDVCAPGGEPTPCRLRNSRRPDGRVCARQ